jgi:hypothetical protein
MAWITPTIAAVGALASTAAAAARSPQEGQDRQALNYAALQQALVNQQNQARVQALINQRSVAGQTDAFGSGYSYDPATNTWTSTLGPQPKAAETAAMQAAVQRNTTDLRQAQLANEEAARRATLAAPGADTAIRNLQTFRPMGSDELVGLLQQQATNAQQNTFRPMIADTLRQFARTGTSAGPVLGEIGRQQSQDLRNSLIDAQIKGMTGVTDINNQRRQGLESSAANMSALANPTFQYSGISPSGVDNTMSQLLSQRAAAAATAPAMGMYGANMASKDLSGAYGTAGTNLADPNFGLNTISTVGKDIGTAFGPGGAGKGLIDYFNSNSNTPQNSPNDQWDLSAPNA